MRLVPSILALNLDYGKGTKPELNVQTRSVYDLIEIAASSVETPPEHAALGLANPGPDEPSLIRERAKTLRERDRGFGKRRKNPVRGPYLRNQDAEAVDEQCSVQVD